MNNIENQQDKRIEEEQMSTSNTRIMIESIQRIGSNFSKSFWKLFGKIAREGVCVCEKKVFKIMNRTRYIDSDCLLIAYWCVTSK